MERKVADSITIESLFERNPNGDFYSQIFEEYLERGFTGDAMYNIPVSPLEFPDVNNSNDNVYISEEIYKELVTIQDITQRTNSEIPYFMIGWEKTDGSISFETIFSDKTQINRTECDHNTITQYVANFLQELRPEDIQTMGRPIICKGHSHGKSNLNVSDNFSYGDLGGYVTLKDDMRSFIRDYNKNGVNPNDIDTTGMLLNPCGDFNMVYYDDREEGRGFYKFNNIQIRTKTGNIVPLPTMSEDGNYLKQSNNKQLG